MEVLLHNSTKQGRVEAQAIQHDLVFLHLCRLKLTSVSCRNMSKMLYDTPQTDQKINEEVVDQTLYGVDW